MLSDAIYTFPVTLTSTVSKLNQVCPPLHFIRKHLSAGEVCWVYISVIN